MTALANPRADRLRELLAADGIVVVPGVTDALTARVAVDVGFEAVYLGGYVMGQTLGMTEPLMTATETIDHAARIADAVEVPVIVDGAAGFGDLLHCRRSVAAFARAGVAAVHVEDQVTPKRARYFEGHTHVVDRASAVAKIGAAVTAAREDHDIVVIGRTDAREAQGGGLDEALWRVDRYLEVGAEVVMPYATCAPTREEAAALPPRLAGPALYVASEGKTAHAELSAGELGAMGWKVVVFNLSALMASVTAVGRVLEHLREHGTSGIDRATVAGTRSRVEALSRLPEMYAVERAAPPPMTHGVDDPHGVDGADGAGDGPGSDR